MLKKLAEDLDLRAINTLGYYYQNELGDFDKAFNCYKHAADNGYIIGIFNLGYCYNNAHGVEKNVIKAKEYYQIVANVGYATALNNLGVIYENEYHDYITAIKYYKVAFGIGEDEAAHNLGLIYEFGKGVRKNLFRAREFYEIAVKAGNERSKISFSRIQIPFI